jgi:uncharacterized protein YbaR (Trm112 family)/SAM-dependent methyltransferase
MNSKEFIMGSLCCPACRGNLTQKSDKLFCQNSYCNLEYPIISDIPIMINDNNSIFSISDFEKQKTTTFRSVKKKWKSYLKKVVYRIIPSISNNLSSKRNFKEIVSLLKSIENPKVLIIGGGVITTGTGILINTEGIISVESDVSFGPRTELILDSHNIPFSDRTFDAVILQAVLEHVIDPFVCISEVERVLKDSGIVYVATPFMQQVHMGRYDFTRFTYLGHRRLLRKFKEIDAGISAGPGVALAWSIKFFLRSLFKNKTLQIIMEILTGLLFFWLKYIDYLTVNNNASYEAASSYYFIGRKHTGYHLSDSELLKSFIGVNKYGK